MKYTVLEENKLVLFTAFEDTTALEDKKGLTVFSAKPVVHCTMISFLCLWAQPTNSSLKGQLWVLGLACFAWAAIDFDACCMGASYDITDLIPTYIGPPPTFPI